MDRKAWIVVSLCSVLLVLNLYFSGKNNEAIARQKAAAASAEEASLTEPGSTVVPGLKVPDGDSAIQEAEKSFQFRTDKTVFTLSSLGGGIASAEFKTQESVYDGEQNVRMNDQGRHRVGGLTTLSGTNLETSNYKVSAETENSITYIGTANNGLGVSKTWSRVEAGEGKDYRLSLKLKLVNTTDTAISLSDIAVSTGSAAALYEDERPNYQSFFWQENGSFDAEDAAWFSGGFFSKARSEYREFKDSVNFAGVENQFFTTILDPVETFGATVRAKAEQRQLPAARGDFEGTVLMSYLSLPSVSLAAGEAKTIDFDIFMGPKRNLLLRSLEGDKGEVMNYGFFSPISNVLNWTLNKLAALFGAPHHNWAWGWAVVALTIVIRTLMWPLHAKSTRTMKRMSKLQPKMAELKEKYPDDPNKMNQEMMKLYREFGVNPMGGCLPMLFQIPIFFGFFTMLQYAVELRNQPFLGWVDDLSQPDTVGHVLGLPINVLPILMAVTMVIQMKVTPQTGDKLQRRIFMLMPLVFFFFCYNFASALALYWTTQNIFSIAQTWFMQRMPEPELKTSDKPRKKGLMQKLTEKAEEAQRLQAAKKNGGGMRQVGPKPPAKGSAQTKKKRGPRTGG